MSHSCFPGTQKPPSLLPFDQLVNLGAHIGALAASGIVCSEPARGIWGIFRQNSRRARNQSVECNVSFCCKTLLPDALLKNGLVSHYDIEIGDVSRCCHC